MMWAIIIFTFFGMNFEVSLGKYMLEDSGQAKFLLSGSIPFIAEPIKHIFILSCCKSLFDTKGKSQLETIGGVS